MELAVPSRPAASAPSAPAAAPAPQRVDLYTPIHKALRAFMSATLHDVGRMDAADDAEVAAALAQTRSLLEMCQGHLEKENASFTGDGGAPARVGCATAAARRARAVDPRAPSPSMPWQPQPGPPAPPPH
jgi:hypothetical protein